MDASITSSGPKNPEDSILNASKPVLVLVGLLALLFFGMYFLG